MKEMFQVDAKISIIAREEGGNVVLFVILNDNEAKRIAFYLMNQDRDILRHREYVRQIKETNGLPIGWVSNFSIYKNIELIHMIVKCPDGEIFKYVSSTANYYYFLDCNNLESSDEY